MIRILIADDYALVRRAFRAILAADPRVAVCAEAVDGEEAVALAVETRPQVVLLDLFMPRLSGIEATRQIRALVPECAVAIVTMHEGAEIERAALAAGASAFLHKSVADAHLLPAIEALAAGRTYAAARTANARAAGG